MARSRFFLEVDPFPVGATDSCFVSTPALRHRRERILRGIREGDKPVCVAAPPGSGRTTLLEQVQRDLGPQWQVATVSGAEGLERGSFLTAFGRAFDLAPSNDGTLADVLDRLEAHLVARLPSDRNALVAVDDADTRSAQLRARLDALLVRRQSSRLRFITTREPVPEDSSGEDAPLMLIDIPPLTRGQSDDYVHTRLCAAGLRGDSPFSDEMLRSIHNASGGRPGSIHTVAARILANRRDRGDGRADKRRRPWTHLRAVLRLRGHSTSA